MTPTRQEELQAFYQQVLPGFLEYVRSHQSAIEQVELATVRDGIVSFPATQVLGGVQKTVRVPLTLITYEIDEEIARCRREAEYAHAQGDYAKAQAEAVTAAGEYAEEQGDYAKAQGEAALAAKETVTAWYTPFHDQVEQWASDAAAAETQRQSNEQTRQSNESARISQEAARVAAELQRIADENTRKANELERVANELERVRDELQRKADEDIRQSNEQTRQTQEAARELAEGLRQQTFETNEAQRQQDFEDAEADRIAAMVVTGCYVDLETMCLMFVQPDKDTTDYEVRNGELYIILEYDD